MHGVDDDTYIRFNGNIVGEVLVDDSEDGPVVDSRREKRA
jgi:hypothetical protein